MELVQTQVTRKSIHEVVGLCAIKEAAHTTYDVRQIWPNPDNEDQDEGRSLSRGPGQGSGSRSHSLSPRERSRSGYWACLIYFYKYST